MTACKPGMIEEDQNHFVWLQSLLPPPPTPHLHYLLCLFKLWTLHIHLNSPSISPSVCGLLLLLFFLPPPISLSPFIVIFFLLLLCIQGFEEVFRGSGGGLHFIKKKYCVVWIENYICMLEGPEGFSVGLAEILPRGGGGRWKMLIWFPPLPTPSPFPFHIMYVCLIFLFFFCMCKPLEEQWHRLEAFLRAVYECSCGVQQSRNITYSNWTFNY